MTRNADNYSYDITLSFAGEDRNIAERLAEILLFNGVRVFYDRHEQANLLGKDLYQYLQRVYRDEACYCVIIISERYANKLWTKHELKQAQARAFEESHEYILPLRLDDTEIPGINSTTGYVDLREQSIEEFAELIIHKITESRDYRTWHLTPTTIDEFSPKLKTALDSVVSLVASDLERLFSQSKSKQPVLSKTVRNQLDSAAKGTGLDIETVIIDDDGIFAHHPWPNLIGRPLQDQWLYREGFADWQINTIRKMKTGYLTWKDQYASDPKLGHELMARRQGYQRRTLVGFRRVKISAGNYWNITIEAHEVSILNTTQKFG